MRLSGAVMRMGPGTKSDTLYHWRASFKEEALDNQNQVNRMSWPSDINWLLTSPLLAPGAEMEL